MPKFIRDNLINVYECECGNRAMELRFMSHRFATNEDLSGVLELYCYGCANIHPIAEALGTSAAWLRKRYGHGRCVRSASKVT